MNIVQAAEHIQTYFDTNWTSTPIAWANVEARDWDVANQPLLPEGVEDYITVKILVPNSQTITVPGHCRRYFGTIYIAISVRKGTGTRRLEGYASELIELLENKRIDSADGEIRVWTLTGNAEFAISDWYVNQIAFGFSFERYVSD